MDFKYSTALYLIAGAVILFVLAQSIFFLVKAFKQGRALGLDKSKLRNAITSSALFTIPSALSILATIIALVPALGPVIPWVRLSVIGNLMYETTAAEAAMRNLNCYMVEINWFHHKSLAKTHLTNQLTSCNLLRYNH